MFEREYRDLSFVPRWAIIRNLHRQSVAEHSFYVALYASQIAHCIGYEHDIGELLEIALYHDTPEHITGDIPGPSKRCFDLDHPAIVEMSGRRLPDTRVVQNAEQKAILKVANLLDEVFHLSTEYQLGNESVRDLSVKVTDRLWVAVGELRKSAFYPEAYVDRLIRVIREAIHQHREGQSRTIEA